MQKRKKIDSYSAVRYLNKITNDANAKHLSKQQQNFFLVLIKPMLLLDPAHLPLLIETSESAQTPNCSVQRMTKILTRITTA